MSLYLKTKDFALSGETFLLEHNEELDMLETKPVPADLSAYYESETYISHTDSRKSLVDKVYHLVKGYTLNRKVALITKLNKGTSNLLDVGAGTGDFLLKARSRNWKVQGVEPNEAARNRAAAKSLELHRDLETVSGKQFEVITLWHVLEHLPDLENQLGKLVELLADNGFLLIAVPNFKSLDASHYKEYWAAYDVPRHLWHFSKTSIGKLFEGYGMKISQTKPMPFDAYYVSLLSEKYRSGRYAYIKAFWTGLRSNLSALRTGEYSSLLYILKKS